MCTHLNSFTSLNCNLNLNLKIYVPTTISFSFVATKARFWPRVPFQLICKAISSVIMEDRIRLVTLPKPFPPPCDNLKTF